MVLSPHCPESHAGEQASPGVTFLRRRLLGPELALVCSSDSACRGRWGGTQLTGKEGSLGCQHQLGQALRVPGCPYGC